MEETSLYIHIPFCKRKCLYCDFNSVVYDDGLAVAYIETLVDQIRRLDQRFYTIYIGGGTPTSLEPKLLSKLLGSLKGASSSAREFTVEANPESLSEEKLKLMRSFGVNRLSIGVQSLDDRKLKRLGRVHNAARAIEAVRCAHKIGFENISIDLIFGVWDEDTGSWKRELEDVVKLSITHISSYSLTYEKNTPIFLAVKNKSISPLEDDVVASMYETAIDMLSLRGFKQYEVSNFAKEGRQCLHNMHYWENGSYVGLGPSAASYIDGVRSKNISDIKDYIKRYDEGKPIMGSSEKLSPVKRAKETAAVKIRTKDGIDFKWFGQKTGFDFLELEKKALPELLEKDFIKYKKENNEPTGVALKRKGFLFCDSVSSALL